MKEFIEDLKKYLNSINLGCALKYEDNGEVIIDLMPGENYNRVLDWINNYQKVKITQGEINY